MKRLLVTTIVLFLGIATISAQEYLDDDFGLSRSNQKRTSSNPFDTNNESKMFRVGGYLDLTGTFVPKSELDENMESYGIMAELGTSAYVADILYFGAGFGYWYQRYNYDYPHSSSYDYKSDNHYLYIPLHVGFQYYINKIGVFCNTGPQFAWLMSSKIDGEKIDVGDDHGFTNWAVKFGLKFEGGELYALYQKGISEDAGDAPFWGIGFGGYF